jgi:hypothetical protein
MRVERVRVLFSVFFLLTSKKISFRVLLFFFFLILMLSHLFGWGKVNLTTLRAAVFSLKKKKKKRKKCARFFHGDESRERDRDRHTKTERD